MQQEGELVRLEQVIGKLLESHQALQRRCQELETSLREREQACGELEQQVAQLAGERSQVADRVQNLLSRIDRWQEDNDQPRSAMHDDGGQGTLFALSS
ncbi:MAG: hypothetical protein BWK76_10285 [Desulfobulbaceae bacterium A2]|nr:MAG: hypothetical protein BWK76_10285 [Desulfobulbaceae bacterium A2]